MSVAHVSYEVAGQKQEGRARHLTCIKQPRASRPSVARGLDARGCWSLPDDALVGLVGRGADGHSTKAWPKKTVWITFGEGHLDAVLRGIRSGKAVWMTFFRRCPISAKYKVGGTAILIP